MFFLLLLHIDTALLVIFINKEEKWAWSFPSDQAERSTCRNIFTIIVSEIPVPMRVSLCQRFANPVREHSRSKKPTGWNRGHRKGRKRGRDAYAGATEPQRDGPEASTHCCSTNKDDCFQSYFNELGVYLLLAR